MFAPEWRVTRCSEYVNVRLISKAGKVTQVANSLCADLAAQNLGAQVGSESMHDRGFVHSSWPLLRLWYEVHVVHVMHLSKKDAQNHSDT